MAIVNIEKMITIDDTGMPKAPNVRQLQDKDVYYFGREILLLINVNIHRKLVLYIILLI